MSGPFLLIAALSGRAAATAAWRAGYVPLVADFFGDRDTCAIAAGVRRMPGDVAAGFAPGALLGALGELAAEAPEPPVGVVYGAGFEDRTALLAEIAERWPLLGNAPDAVAAVKHPWRFAEVLARLGISHPEIHAADGPAPPGWLAKRQGGAGGGHVAAGDGDAGASEHTNCSEGQYRVSVGSLRYRQRQVAGQSISALFLASHHGADIVGFSEQWTAPAPGQPFRFGGAVHPAVLPDDIAASLGEAIGRVAAAFSLRGLNSADFIVGRQGWWLLEINPRLGATLDIFDTPDGTLMQAHLAAARGSTPVPVAPVSGAKAMQVIYASHAVRVPAIDWPGWTADQPHPGEDIPAEGPLCTILAAADTPCEARRLCLKRSNDIQERVGVEECRTLSVANTA